MLEVADRVIYMAIGLRDAGSCLAVLHGWHVAPPVEDTRHERPGLEEFRRQQRGLYIPSGSAGFWQGAIRDPADPGYEALISAETEGRG